MTLLSLALNGAQVQSAELNLPYVGLWVCELALNTPTAIPSTPGGCALTIGNLSLKGTALRAANFAGARSAMIVGGFGGWSKPVAARAYSNPAGNTLSMILEDLALEAGELLELVTDGQLSGTFAREGSTADNPVPASRLLRSLAGAIWWVDGLGVTHVGPRLPLPITSPFTVVSWSGARGAFEIATEDPASWQPGATFSSDTVTTAQTIGSVAFSAGNDGVARLRVLATGEQVAA